MTTVRTLKRLFLISVLAISTAACGAKMTKDYSSFYSSSPRSILVVPVMNHSQEPEANDLFLSTVPVPLAEKGFYVFPVNMVKDMMEQDGLSDAQLVHSAPTQRLASLFGADAVLYIEIMDWRSRYIVISANIIVEFLYTLKDGRTGDLLWQHQQELTYSSSGNSGNAIADLIVTAITAAVQSVQADYSPVAVAANNVALLTAGNGIPFGPYSPNIGKNDTEFPATGDGNITNATDVAVSYPFEVTVNPD